MIITFQKEFEGEAARRGVKVRRYDENIWEKSEKKFHSPDLVATLGLSRVEFTGKIFLSDGSIV